jgi:murein DD-endopeptidase MepM/ murein hydrolase activator NlpD
VARFLPGATRGRALTLLVAAGVLAAGTLVPLTAPVAASQKGRPGTHELQHRKHRVASRIHGASRDLDDSSARLRTATAALVAAQHRLASARLDLDHTRGALAAAQVLDQQMQDRLDAARLRLQRARADLAAARTDIADEQRLLGQIVVANYQGGDPSLLGLSMVLTSQDPAELTGELNVVHNVMDRESVVLDRLEASRTLRALQERQVADARRAVAVQRRAAAANLARKQQLEADAEAAATAVRGLVGERASARQAAERAKRADLAELRALQRERDQITTVLRRRAAAARRRAAARSGGVLADGGPHRSSGFLDYPVIGPVTSPFGWRIHPIYGYRSLHDGVDFGVACGTPIRAAAAGRVVARYYQTAWGNRVIIDHGWHRGVALATIANHMSAPAIVAPGQRVSRGQVVGYVGTTGWSTGCHLHFTVLQNGVAVDPMRWF